MKPHPLLSLLPADIRVASALATLCCLSAVQVSAQSKPADPAATAPAAAATGPAAKAAATAADDESVIRLTPFEVHASHDHGYFSPTTLAGTRLNNNIADIPSSVTVVNQQQLLDTSSWDINDVFRYEANTEGASTYTPIAMVRGNVADVLATQPQTSGNRVRGLTTADLEVDNYFSLSRIPFDSYNTQSLEVDRGPNSILFGTGSPAGIVNQTRARAVIDKTSGSVSLVGGSWGTYRQSSNFNIPVIPHKLAIYLAQAYTNQGFKQKPSTDIARREYAAFTFVPFKSQKTKLTGSFEYYNHDQKDPNGVTPVDFVTPWLQSGRPVYNPLNDMVTYLNTGVTSGPYAQAKNYPNYAGILQTDMGKVGSPYFVPSLNYASTGHNFMFMNQGQMENFYRGQQTGFTVTGFVPPVASMTSQQLMLNQEKVTWSVPLPTPTGYQVWQYPSVTSKSIYDWSTVNLNPMAYEHTEAKTYYLDLQQELLPNLNLDVGWFRQELKQFSDSPLSQSNATTIYVDTNQYLLTGQANPHLGQPFVDGYASDIFESPEINNNFRASLEYELNIQDHVPNWLKWLGHHRLMTVLSQHDDSRNDLRYRESIVGGDPNYLPSATTLNQATGYGYPVHNTAVEAWYYLGTASNGYGFGNGSPGTSSRPPISSPITLPIQTYNYANNSWQTTSINMQSVLFPSGGRSENVQDTKTYFWQAFMWNDRIVGTFGINDDFVKSRQNVFPSKNPESFEYTNGFPNYQYWNNMGAWNRNSGRTTTTGLVFHPLQHWGPIDRAAANGSFLAGLARSVSLTFNRSSNFNPPPAYYTDFFGNPLAKPQGTERDYGFEIATPDNKFFLRATWFRTANQNQFVSNTSNARAIYIDNELKNWATAVVEVRHGENPSDSNFGNTSVYPITQQMQDEISAITGLPYTFGGNVGEKGQFVNPYETADGIARGIELELTYNPTRNWRMKFAWAKQKTILSNIASQAAAWFNYRMPKWQAYTANDLTQVYTRSNGRAMSLANFWQGYGYDGNIYQNHPYGWNTTQDYFNVVVNAQLATDRALNNTQATNQRVYSWSYLSTYDFTEGRLNGFMVGGAFRYDGRAVAGYYGDTANLNPSGNIFQPDVNKPIYTPRQIHVDAWIGYRFRMPWAGHGVQGRVQLNVADLTQNGRLLPVTFNYDGSPAAQRIIAPRKFTLSTTFSF